MRDEDMTMKNGTSFDRHRTLRRLGALAGLSVMLGACTNTTGEVVTASVPEDYRLRHPIAVEEANHSIVIFVGSGRGGLSATERADVVGLGRTWLSEGTGAITVDVPVDTPNARAAAYAAREIKSLLVATGVPSNGIRLNRFHPEDPRTFATIKLTYPKITAVAGPCGIWPADLGPSIENPGYFENRSYYNFGCAYQRNVAAMVANPADLEQPRPETPAYTIRRTEAFEKYRKGNPTSTAYPEEEKAKLSDTGK
jgi:pilus assembly protein CpaD